MAAASKDEVVFWPDLRRFGAELKVVLNPSVNRKFLKFTIFDRERFAREGGVPDDSLAKRLRDAGFAYCANETAANAARAYDMALRQGFGIREAEHAASHARGELFFYSLATHLKHARLQTLVPNLSELDYREIPIASVREADQQFLSSEAVNEFIRSQQQLRDARAGHWFSTPEDRALLVAVKGAAASVHEVLGYRDLPPDDGTTRLDDAAVALTRLSPVQLMERVVRKQTLGMNGMPLRAPGLDAVIIGYSRHEDAVRANGGDPAGIEEHLFEYSVPVGFDADTGRLLVLKDARFLEYNAEQIPHEDEIYSVQRHIDFMTGVAEVRRHYDELAGRGDLEASAWTDVDTTRRIKEQCETIFAVMKSTLAPVAPTRGFIELADIARFGSQREDYFREARQSGFLDFLRIFQTQMYNAVQLRWRELVSQAVLDRISVGRSKLVSTPSIAEVSGLLRAGLTLASDGANQDAPPPPANALSQIVRIGETRRADMDIDDGVLEEIFGIRSVQYGIWLPRREWQAVRNHAFDALMDLAHVLQVPPHAIGLGNTLSLAFGARGTAGRGATAAFYEPGNQVLHLPGAEGAGTIAHEWARAFDAWLARTALGAEHASIVELAADAATELSGLPAVVRDLAVIGQRMKVVPMSTQEVVEAWSMAKIGERAVPLSSLLANCIEDWVAGLDALLPADKQHGEFRAFALDRLSREWEPVPGLDAYHVMRLRDPQAFIGDVEAKMDEQQSGNTAWRQRAPLALPTLTSDLHEAAGENLRRAVNGPADRLYRRNTEFFGNALWHDAQGRTKRWATDTQLFGRLFASWVQERIEMIPGNRSPYLVAGCTPVDNESYPVYPRGTDRQALFELLDRYFSRHTTELVRLLDGKPAPAYEVQRLFDRASEPRFG